MLFNEITVLDQIHNYIENSEESIEVEVANSFPINCGRGLLYLEKEAKDSAGPDKKEGSKNPENFMKNEMHDVDPLVYFVMPRYGKNLQSLLGERNLELSNASVFHLGLSLLNCLEVIHNSGLVFNDIKPDNILIGHR